MIIYHGKCDRLNIIPALYYYLDDLPIPVEIYDN